MADWIKWVGGLEDRAEVIAIAQRLNLPPVHVAGACCVLWLWARQEGRVTGNRCHVRHATVESCDRQVAVKGFGEAMKAVEWLVEEDGGITFPRWNVHNSDSAKSRAMAQLRMAKSRSKSVALSLRSRCAARATQAQPEKSRVEKSREEENTGPIRPPVVISNPVGGVGGTGPGDIPGPEAGPDRTNHAFVQTLTLRIVTAFGWRGEQALAQSKSIGAVARRLCRLDGREELAERMVELAREKASDGTLKKPAAAWQREVDRIIGGRGRCLAS